MTAARRRRRRAALERILRALWGAILDPPGVWFAGLLTLTIPVRLVWLAADSPEGARAVLENAGATVGTLYLGPLGTWLAFRTVKRLRAEKRLEREAELDRERKGGGT